MTIRTVNCPTCQRPVAWDKKSTFKPFCSERCKLIDLGEWADEKHAIAGEKVYVADNDEFSID
ncbi:MAG: DNA gyrase inhibitor YacG [Cycloclasticus sp.]|jgi:Uncharacterized protein conserved in bacteria|nr:DNA gyrase inhibitor YacG [Cycloclasticus sp.]MBG96504.1 DNA gyrase inhibitor YacG [Cycloclasticus sp.]HAI96020.1 DNA gyrase inhibitor YacG [Methylococcaceae bacterium]|tara:strand:- start:37 stop:225 length:189 start_codon:yes stop_codon:yes gene_type:complete